MLVTIDTTTPRSAPAMMMPGASDNLITASNTEADSAFITVTDDMDTPPGSPDKHLNTRAIQMTPRTDSPTPSTPEEVLASRNAGWPLDNRRVSSEMTFPSQSPAGPGPQAGKSVDASARKIQIPSIYSRDVNKPSIYERNVNKPSMYSSQPAPSKRKRTGSFGQTDRGTKVVIQVPEMAHLGQAKTTQGDAENGLFVFDDSPRALPSMAIDPNVLRQQSRAGIHEHASAARKYFSNAFGAIRKLTAKQQPDEENQIEMHELDISSPSDFKHVFGGSQVAVYDDPNDNINAILMELRSESRIDNETALPVNMPNAYSPIRPSAYGWSFEGKNDKKGDSKGKSKAKPELQFFGPIIDPFSSPTSPRTSIPRPPTRGKRHSGPTRPAAEPSPTRGASGIVFPGTNKARIFGLFSEQTCLLVVTVLFWGAIVSTVASGATTIAQRARGEPDSVGVAVWLSFSLASFFLVGIALTVLWARQYAFYLRRKWADRYGGGQDDLEQAVAIPETGMGIDLRVPQGHLHPLHRQRLPTDLSANPLPDILAYRQAVKKAGDETQRQALAMLRSDPVRCGEYIVYMEREIEKLQRTCAAHKRAGGIWEIVSIPASADGSELAEQDVSAETVVRAADFETGIGLARSESFINDGTAHREGHGPLSISSLSVGSYNSEATERPILSQPNAELRHAHTDKYELPQLPPLAHLSSPASSGIPHSDAMSDLPIRSANNTGVGERSATQSTIGSLLSSYATTSMVASADETNIHPLLRAASTSSPLLGTQREALGSHPVNYQPVGTNKKKQAEHGGKGNALFQHENAKFTFRVPPSQSIVTEAGTPPSKFKLKVASTNNKQQAKSSGSNVNNNQQQTKKFKVTARSYPAVPTHEPVITEDEPIGIAASGEQQNGNGNNNASSSSRARLSAMTPIEERSEVASAKSPAGMMMKFAS